MRIASLLVALLFAALGRAAAAQEQKTVVDYYLAAPAELLPYEVGEDRMKSIEDSGAGTAVKVKDVRNGYMRLSCRDGGVEVKLFPGRDGAVVLGISLTGCCCEGSCTRVLRFLSFRGGQWSNITSEVWPAVSPEEVVKAMKRGGGGYESETMAEAAVYQFSRRSTVVRIVGGTVVAFRFRWNKDRFVRF